MNPIHTQARKIILLSMLTFNLFSIFINMLTGLFISVITTFIYIRASQVFNIQDAKLVISEAKLSCVTSS